MGPQLDSCGRTVGILHDALFSLASMGPQLDSCGRRIPAADIVRRSALQWGRNLTVAEGVIRIRQAPN